MRDAGSVADAVARAASELGGLDLVVPGAGLGRFAPTAEMTTDDLDLVRPEALADSFRHCLEIVDVLETNTSYINLNPKGEPQLGKRGLYRSVAGGSSTETALLWVLNLSDGQHSLLDITDRSGLPYARLREAAETLRDHELLEEVGET